MEDSAKSSIEDWCEQVQINLGPNVGDITIGYDPPRRGRVIPLAVHNEKAQEDVATLYSIVHKSFTQNLKTSQHKTQQEILCAPLV